MFFAPVPLGFTGPVYLAVFTATHLHAKSVPLFYVKVKFIRAGQYLDLRVVFIYN